MPTGVAVAEGAPRFSLRWDRFVTEEGLAGMGFRLVGPRGGVKRPYEVPLSGYGRNRACSLEVAGESYSTDLWCPCFAPGEPLRVERRQATQTLDGLAVLDSSGTYRAGWVPRGLVEEFVATVGDDAAVTALWEYRRPDNRRVSLELLVAEPGAVAGTPRRPSEYVDAAEYQPPAPPGSRQGRPAAGLLRRVGRAFGVGGDP